MTDIILILLQYAVWWFPIAALIIPCILWALSPWLDRWAQRREQARWDRLAGFFADNRDKFPEAGAAFNAAECFHEFGKGN